MWFRVPPRRSSSPRAKGCGRTRRAGHPTGVNRFNRHRSWPRWSRSTAPAAITIAPRAAGCRSPGLDPSNAPADAEVWEKVIRKVRTGMMPPSGVKHPDPATRATFVTTLASTLDRAAAGKPNPGRPALYRLNRTEYANAIRDLLELEVDASTLLPPDDSAYGFDNVADVLSVSSTLMQQYVSAAGKISALAIGSQDVSAGSQVFSLRQDASQDRHVDGLPFGTVGGLLARPVIQVEGEYTLSSKFFRTNLGVMRGLEYEHWMEYAVDGKARPPLQGGRPRRLGREPREQHRDRRPGRRAVAHQVAVDARPHDISVAWLDKGAAPDPYRVRPPVRSSHDPRDPAWDSAPADVHRDRPLRRRRQRRHAQPGAESSSASPRRTPRRRPRRRAPRGSCQRWPAVPTAGRPPTATQQRLVAQYRDARRDGDFETGIEAGLQRLLASPKFIFRVERDPAAVRTGEAYALTDYELASRLAFFLWSSIPTINCCRWPARDAPGARRARTPGQADAG
jgi:hypothetical protein